MGRLAVIDGEVYQPDQAMVSVYDRGFLYGDGVFETVRTYGGVVYALEEHLERLADSATKMGVTLPATVAELAAETRAAVSQSGNAESYARIMLTRGSGPVGLDPTLAERALRVILIEPLVMPPADQYENGISARCIETVRASDAADNAKVGNYLASALALRKARDEGAHEALVVSREGVVVEGTTSNVFVVDDGALVTPALDAGVLAGITRRCVLELAEQQQIDVSYRALTPDEIVRSDEVFLTSSIRELMPVIAIDGHQINDGRPGPLTRQLHRAFRKHVGMDGKLPFEVRGVALGDA